jgi:hypothetical protein
MKVRTTLFLAAMFATAALAVALLPACSDDPGEGGDTVRCSLECDECFEVKPDGTCNCFPCP